MTPKQARLGVDIFTALVVASVAFALASLTWRLQGYSGQPAAMVPASAGFDSVDVAPILALAPFGNPANVSITADAAGLELRAVFAAVPASASVALIALPDGQVVPFAIGEATPAGVIESIEPEKVTLRANGGLRFLGFNPQNAAPAAGAVAPPPAALPSVSTPSATAPRPAPTAGAAAIRALIPGAAVPPAPPSPAPTGAAPGNGNTN
ncbi:type II secretion system protein N [Tsuneonella sp. HG222]